MIHSFEGITPKLHESTFVESSAHVIGDVVLGEDASVWFGCVVRGDVCHIRIGARTNIQDLTVIHVNHGTHPTILEDEITVGHRAILHGCHIREHSLIGMGAVVMDDAEVGPESIVAAGSLVSPGTRVPPRKLVRGIPARVVRPLSREELAGIRESVADYVKLKNIYLEKGRL